MLQENVDFTSFVPEFFKSTDSGFIMRETDFIFLAFVHVLKYEDCTKILQEPQALKAGGS